MAYSDVAALAVDPDFRARIAAAAATDEPLDIPMHPLTFADTYQWQVSGAPGFGDAYASALASGVERPGNDPSVISDAQILAAIQPILTDIMNPPGPNP